MFQTAAGVTVPFPEKLSEQYEPVSYTHLTLPTIA